MSGKKISFSEMGTLASCPHKHHLRYTLGLRGPDSWVFEFGKFVHKLCEMHAKNPDFFDDDEQKKQQDLFLKNVSRETFKDLQPPNYLKKDVESGDLTVPLAWWMAALHAYLAYAEWIDEKIEQKWTILGVEQEIKLTLRHGYVIGYADLILVDPDNNIHIYDIKTSRSSYPKNKLKPQHEAQLLLYSIPYNPKSINILNIYIGSKTKPPELQERKKELTNDQYKNIIINLLEASLELSNNISTPPPFGLLNGSCEWCDLEQFCAYQGGQEPEDDL